MKEVKTLIIRGNIVDIFNRKTFGAKVCIENGRIIRITPTGEDEDSFLLPGFIDAHIHIESSMTTPAAFIRTVIRHGTVGAVADPHEIANVLGKAGIEFLLDNAQGIPFYLWMGVPSCVPTTTLETAGAILDAEETERLLQRDDLHFLAEMMNYPGVLNKDPEVIRKIEAAKKVGKPIDGHFPLGYGEDLKQYIAAGISTDHETNSLEQGRERCRLGMKILIREGSAARNFETLHPLLSEFPEQTMFCTDDAHPCFIEQGHIDRLVRKAIHLGYDLYDVLRTVSYNPAIHYRIPAGFLRKGDPADFIRVNNLNELKILETYIQGVRVFDGQQCSFPFRQAEPINNFQAQPVTLEQLTVRATGKKIRVIVCQDRELVTKEELVPISPVGEFVVSDPERDILKLAVVNRYQPADPAVAFLKGTGLKRGAVAQSIAHDSHNIIAVGATDAELQRAINSVIREKGGIAVCDGENVTLLPLPIAGLMNDWPLEETSKRYHELEREIRRLGSPMESLQMTLSFMALLVIPSRKLSDRGLFDGDTFQFTSLFV